jgi:DNA polymerase III alpha subunit
LKINPYGQVEVSESEAFQSLYSKKITDLKSVYIDQESAVEQYNLARKINADRIPQLSVLQEPEISIEEFDKTNQKNWFMPKDYCPNLVEQLYAMCENQEQTDRVSLELELFIQHGMMDLLYYIKYLVDTMRANKIVWGVGRGSSVASYVLYLIGVHKIDSIKYQLDINEFLK